MVMATAAVAGALDKLPFSKKLKLAKVGDEEAQLSVGLAYDTGKDVKPDKTAAVVWYRRAAEQGSTEAQFRLARIMQEGAKGVEAKPEVAAKLYLNAAKQGHVAAQNWYGYCLQHGLGVTANEAEAVTWYRKAADAGMAAAQNNLGLMYLNGKGVAQDKAQAFAAFSKAAAQGDGWGLNNLGGLYELGWGVTQDKAKALELYKSARDKGIKQAEANIARLAKLTTETGTAATPASPEPKVTEAEPKAAEPAPEPVAVKPPEPPKPTVKVDSSPD
jgi:hypothetical protein